MKKFLAVVLFSAALSTLSSRAEADVTNDLWDVSQGNVVIGMSVAGVYPGSDIRNMFGGNYGSIEVGNTVFPDGQIFGPGSVALVSWKTPTTVDLSRFVLSVAADGTPEISYNRAIQGFNLYASNIFLDVYADWGTAIYSSGLLPTPLGDYNPATTIYSYTIGHTFSSAISSEYFKADIIYGSYVTGPRIIELDGYGTTRNDPVPEPATMILFGTGLAGLAAVSRRKKSC